jgi:hypothetical protein
MFFGWLLFRNVLIVTVTVVAAAAVMWVVRRKRVVIKVIVGIFSIPLGLLGMLLLGFIAFGELMGCDTHGIPQYSPNGKIAARTETSDEGALGGDTFVTLYTTYGFSTKSIFHGGTVTVRDNDIRWLDDSHLVVHYKLYGGLDEVKFCEGTARVQVTCVPDAMK